MPVSVLERELAQIAAEGGCSIFWLTETQARARRLERAERAGRLVRRRSDPRDAYPWMVFTVTPQETHMDGEDTPVAVRTITDHRINDLNEALVIVSDARQPETGNGSHHYSVTAHEAGKPTWHVAQIDFQHGPIGEVGVNGVTNEALLAIVIDRLRGWQAGPFACRENALALTKLEEALHWLHARSLDRVARGVEGTYQR